MANKLKNMQLTSVDLVRAGANQEADICLFKSADSQPPADGTIPVEKEHTTFNQITDNRENSEKLWQYTDALNCSIRSIMDDHDLSKEQRSELMLQSLQQFDSAMKDLIGKLASGSPARKENAVMAKADFDEIEEVEAKKA